MSTPGSVAVRTDTRAVTHRTRAYVLGDEAALLVDPPATEAALDALVAERDAAHVAATHHHPDHVAGIRAYADREDLTVWALRGREAAFEAAAGVAPDRTFGPGTTIPAGPGVRVLDTPGHAAEHVAFETGDGLVTGDLAVAEGTVVVDDRGGDMRAYLTSLRRVRARDPGRLYPSHGPDIERPIATLDRLIDHRRRRERRVMAAVRDGARHPAAILDAAYEKDVSDVRDLALATVRAHLDKLAHEGRVAWDGQRARPA